MYMIEVLEYDKVLKIIKNYCISDYSKKRLLRVKPDTNRDEVLRSFEELKEIKTAIEEGIFPNIINVNDILNSLKKSSIINNFLDPDEFLFIKKNVTSFNQLKNRISPYLNNLKLVSQRLSIVKIPYRLVDDIDKIIDRYGNIREDASDRLFEINKEIRSIRSSIEKTLENYFYSSETKNCIREKIITYKDDRYVIPIKHNFKGKIPGIVHAYSGSGETLFLEPFSITSKNNELKLMYKQMEKEKRFLLIKLTETVFKCSAHLKKMQEILSDIDIIIAKYNFMKEYRCSIPQIVDERLIEIKGGRHPLIKGEVVPVNFTINNLTSGVVITGPNTGGKTVSLKLIGLFVLLAKAGFPVPAVEMKTFFFSSLFADIGDEQSIEQSLSTFSAHIKNIKHISEKANERSLVLIDELGAGTDPIEGGAIGTALFDYLTSSNILTIVTTHFSMIKMYALNKKNIEVASVEFDPKTCMPTYKLIMGIPGRSNAIDIARHLGLKEDIIKRAIGYLSDKDISIDSIFKNLGTIGSRLGKKEEKIEREEEKLNVLISNYKDKLERVLKREEYIKKDYKKEMSSILREFRKRLERSIKEIKEQSASKSSIKYAKEKAKEIEKEFLNYNDKGVLKRESLDNINIEIKIGDVIQCVNKNGECIRGRVLELREDGIIMQSGILKFEFNRKDMVTIKNIGKAENKNLWEYETVNGNMSVNVCDLRGKRYEEAMGRLIKFLDNAVLKNIDTVSIIHGMGTGALREGVWKILKNYKHALEYEYANGGFGCTVVKLEK